MNDRDELVYVEGQLAALKTHISVHLTGDVPPPAPDACHLRTLALYKEAYGRNPLEDGDIGGFNYWTTRCRGGESYNDQRAAFGLPPIGNPPPPPNPNGDSSTIVPVWGQWNEQYTRPGYWFQPGRMSSFIIPTQPNLSAYDGVSFSIGQTPSQDPNAGFECCLSLTPGVMNRNDLSRYINTGKGGFRNNFLIKVTQRESGYNPSHAFEAYVSQGQWYMVVNPLIDVPSLHSIQWS